MPPPRAGEPGTGDGDAQAEAGSPGAQDGADNGSAIVEFVLVGTLLLIVILGVIQVGLVLHVRNTLAADAAEGARHAANVDVPAAEGGTYAQQLIAESLPGRSDAVCTGQEEEGPGDIPLVRVTCTVVVPLSLVPLGDGVTLTVTGHAVKETP
ncbi:pilus assembly protein [Frankia sp. Cpl3]|uniref:TadE family protein n=1 Tax=Parafrankia colletiae TaxID=573497 RepID=UPI000A046AF3|nr:TadE/TadG family type IV pilus assembly protein [Parafrankia colletiae]MCK9904815.1 pilus assembly protein [Frankia sp. Cpl3]